MKSLDCREAAPPYRNKAGFSLIEIIVTVALLTVIILGLVAMFDQTRRAFTSSFTQVDVLESGRSTADFLAREAEQMTPYGLSNIVNFYVDAPQSYNNYPLLNQTLVDPGDIRTNLLQEVYYLTRNNQQWMAIGYKIDTNANGIGSLYRFTTNISSWQQASNSLYFFTTYFPTYLNTNSFSRLIDGVVDFRIHAFDTNGIGFGYFPLSNGTPVLYGTYPGPLSPYGLRPYPSNALPSYSFSVMATNYYPYTGVDDFFYRFTSNSVPAYVELELGVLEDRSFAHYNALTNAGFGATSPAWAYLTNHAGKVHLFRQHVPIRNVNPAAFQ